MGGIIFTAIRFRGITSKWRCVCTYSEGSPKKLPYPAGRGAAEASQCEGRRRAEGWTGGESMRTVGIRAERNSGKPGVGAEGDSGEEGGVGMTWGGAHFG